MKAGDIEKRNPCMRLHVSTTSASSRLPSCSLTSMAALTPVKTTTSRRPPIRNSPASTVWKKPCLAITPPRDGEIRRAAQQRRAGAAKRISELAFPPSKVVGGAAGLIEEVAASKISGEEDRYSHTDLWDFRPTSTAHRKLSICCGHSCKRERRTAGESGCQF